MRAFTIFRAAFALGLSTAVLVAETAGAAEPRSGMAAAPPVSGHAQVVAQGVAAFTAGTHHWRLVTHDVGTSPATIDSASPTFLVAAGGAGPVRVNDPNGLGWLLAAGEATFRPAESTTTIEPAPGAVVHEISIDPGSGDGAFDPGDGLRDLDLVRDVLASGESITVRSAVSALLFVTSGVVTDAAGAQVAAGTTQIVTGEASFTNNGPDPAVVVVAIIGTMIGAPQPTTTPTGGGDGPAPTQPSTTPAPTTSPTTIDPTLDTDGDGLTDVEEADIYGTDPNNYDTDGDTVSDYLEAKNGYSDPFNPDTDGDGFDDSEQFDGYDPFDPTSYPGAPGPSVTSAP